MKSISSFLLFLFLFAFVISVCERDKEDVEDATSVDDCINREFKNPNSTYFYKCCYYEAENPDNYKRGRGCYPLTKEQYDNLDEYKSVLGNKLGMKLDELECDPIERPIQNNKSNFIISSYLILMFLYIL